MAKIRVYELARQLGVPSTTLRAHLEEMGVETSSASSTLDDVTIAAITERLSTKTITAPTEAEEEDEGLEPVSLPQDATVKDFATALDTDVENVMEELQRLGHEVHLPTQILDADFARQVARGWGYKLVIEAPPPPAPPTPAPVAEPAKAEPTPEAAASPTQPRIVYIEKEAERIGERRLKPPPPPRTPAPAKAAPEPVVVKAPEPEVVAAEVQAPAIWRPETPADAPLRPPVVTVMGHVDHGKTTLLDYIRKSKVTASEAGGITQHIGAYQVELNGRKITFLDTPGHEAFTAIRARGAQVTDIAIVIVGADDGVMPQTLEAIDHARAASVPIVVAMNKIDRPQANIGRVQQQLAEAGLTPVAWGGEIEMIPVSALDGTGIDDLLDTVLALADLLEIKASVDKPAAGTIIESSLDRRRGPLATIIVQEGILHVGDVIVAGLACGKIRTMNDHLGKLIKQASPSTPVSITGMTPVPAAGDVFQVVDNEKLARQIAEERRLVQRSAQMKSTIRTSLQDLYLQIAAGEVKELNLVVKADAQGSLDAIAKSLLNFQHPEVKVNVLHRAIGEVSESDVLLAAASNGIIVGFQVGIDAQAKRSAADEKVEVRLYKIIYDVLDDVRQALVGLLPVQLEEVVLGQADLRALFKSSSFGTVAGCLVTSGKMVRGAKARVRRGGTVIATTTISSLRHVKADVPEVSNGTECGIVLSSFSDYRVGDLIEAYEIREIRRQVL